MSSPSREPAEAMQEAEERRTKVAELFLRGLPQHRIARELGCSQSCVSKDLDAVRAEMQERASADRAGRIAEALAKLDLAEALLWQQGNLKLLLRCLDMRFRVLGAYKVQLLLPTGVPWDAVADPRPSDEEAIEGRLADADRNGEVER